MHRQEQYKNLMKTGLSFVVWSGMTLIWALCWMQNYAEIILRPFGYKGNWLMVAVYAVLVFLFTSFYGGYRIGYYRPGDVMLSGLLAMGITNVVTYLQTCLVGRAIMEMSPFFWMSALQAVLIVAWAWAANRLYVRCFPPHRLLLIYGGAEQARSLICKLLSREEKYQIQEAIHIDEGLEQVQQRLQHYRAAVLCGLPPKQRNSLLKYCFQHAIRTYTTPKVSDILIRGAVNINLFDTPLLLNRNNGLAWEQQVVKRLMDIAFSLAGLALASPLMLLIACAIKCGDGGPVFYKQKRLTIYGRTFDLYKFRSMIVDAEKEQGAQWALEEDHRVTPVGRVLRRLRLDELPQLWNILKGEMSVVGPRPERPELAEEFRKIMPEFDYRLKVKAGLTGYAQVIGRYNTSIYDKLKMDVMYIAGYSLLEDIKLILMTVKILLMKESTEGVAADQERRG